MLLLGTESLWLQKMQECQSAPDGELLCCCSSVDAGPVDTSPLALRGCGISNRTGPHARWSPFSIKDLSNSVLCL